MSFLFHSEKLTDLLFSTQFLPFFAVSAPSIFAHPGNTDKRGGHYCRTNCPKWGLKYGQYHYHGKKR